MIWMDDKPHKELIDDWLDRIGYTPAFYESHTPVRQTASVKRLTKRERQLVDAVSTERGYRPFQAFGRSL
jgi:hypothetical protein